MITKQHADRPSANDTARRLSQMGKSSHFQTQLESFGNEDFIPARVIGTRKNRFPVRDGKREWLATPAGRLKHHSDCLYPVAGDWILMIDTVIFEVLTRKKVMCRGAAGTCTYFGRIQVAEFTAADRSVLMTFSVGVSGRRSMTRI